MRKKLVIIFVMLSMVFSLSGQMPLTGVRQRNCSLKDEEKSRKVVEVLKMMKDRYPEAQYRDVYKNFMQDYFGPGHILSDTIAASRYMSEELQKMRNYDGPAYEPTGYNGNFYRVNLSLVKDSIIPYDKYFHAFFRSVSGIVTPPHNEWESEWMAIDGIIRDNGFSYQEEEFDRKEIMDLLSKGNFVVHHSERFNNAYELHYRIISKEIFLTELLPLIEKSRQK